MFCSSWRWGASSQTGRRSRTWRQSSVQLQTVVRGRPTSHLLVGTGERAVGEMMRRHGQARLEQRLPFKSSIPGGAENRSHSCRFQDYGPSRIDEVGLGLTGDCPSKEQRTSHRYSLNFLRLEGGHSEDEIAPREVVPRHLGKQSSINNAC